MGNESSLVSAVIPAYNAESFLKETIESVLAQTYKNIECIVVNDGSTDGTAEVAKSFGDRIRYFEKPNGGVSSARNLGIANARGELIAFLDADDLWHAEKIEKQVAVLLKHGDLGMVYCGSVDVTETLETIQENPVIDQDALVEEILLLGTATGRIASTAMTRKQTLNLIGKFDEQLSTSADADYVCRMLRKAKISGIGEPLTLYRVHGNQMHHNLNALEHDMNIVLHKLYSTPDLPDWVRGLRRRAYARLETTLAIGYLSKKQLGKVIRHSFTAIGYRPQTFLVSIAQLVGSKLR
ncbi:MAG: glycosyltransferase [Pyrinomonadaceae bacterium]